MHFLIISAWTRTGTHPAGLTLPAAPHRAPPLPSPCAPAPPPPAPSSESRAEGPEGREGPRSTAGPPRGRREPWPWSRAGPRRHFAAPGGAPRRAQPRQRPRCARRSPTRNRSARRGDGGRVRAAGAQRRLQLRQLRSVRRGAAGTGGEGMRCDGWAVGLGAGSRRSHRQRPPGLSARPVLQELAPGGRARPEGAAAAGGPQDRHHHRGRRLQGEGRRRAPGGAGQRAAGRAPALRPR